MSRSWRARWMPAHWVYSGEAGRQMAEEIAATGRSGVVVAVRYPPDRPWRGLHRDWRELQVRATGGFERRFCPALDRRFPFYAAVEPGEISVQVVNQALERLEISFPLAPGCVQVVDVRPPLDYMFVWKVPASIALGVRIGSRLPGGGLDAR